MKRSESKKSVMVTIKEENDKLTVENGLGQEWQFPKRMSKRVALSALVYGAILNAQETISAYSSKYRISIEIENLDVEDDGAQ
jgi:hypothetical protein